MTLSMYQASVPVFTRQFTTLLAILTKAEAFVAEKGIDPKELIEARLIEDMFPLARQIQIATDGAKGCIARLAGVEIPSFADTETSFAELRERIERTLAFIHGFPADQIDGTEDKAITIKLPTRELNLTGQQLLLHFALPNFFFHVTTTYALLRMKGVPVGKMDYLGDI